MLLRAHALHSYHGEGGLDGTDLDAAVLADLRPQVLADYASVLQVNRAVTLHRRGWRAAAMTTLLWSLLSVIVATIIVMAGTIFDLLPSVSK